MLKKYIDFLAFQLYLGEKNRMSSRFFFFFSFFSSFSWLRGAGKHGAVQKIDVVFGKEVMWMDDNSSEGLRPVHPHRHSLEVMAG